MQLSKVGGWVSILCAMHCMASPVILGLIPVIHAESPAVERIEGVLIVVSVLIAVIAIGTGYREHRRAWLIGLLLVSLTILAAGRMTEVEALEAPLVIAGATILAAAQFLNFRYQRQCCRPGESNRSELSSIARRV